MTEFEEVGELEWSDQLKQGAAIEQTQHVIDLIDNPAKLTVSDVRQGRCVTRVWKGLRANHAELANRAELKQTLHQDIRN